MLTALVNLGLLMCLVTQSCPTLCDPVDCSLAGSYVHGIFQARILEQGCHFPPPGYLPSPGIKVSESLCLLHCRWILYPLSHQGSPTHLCLILSKGTQDQHQTSLLESIIHNLTSITKLDSLYRTCQNSEISLPYPTDFGSLTSFAQNIYCSLNVHNFHSFRRVLNGLYYLVLMIFYERSFIFSTNGEIESGED